MERVMPPVIKPAIVILAIACTPPLAVFTFGQLGSFPDLTGNFDAVRISLIIVAFVSLPFVVGAAASKVIGYRKEKRAVVVVFGSIVSIVFWVLLVARMIFDATYGGH